MSRVRARVTDAGPRPAVRLQGNMETAEGTTEFVDLTAPEPDETGPRQDAGGP